MSRKRAEIKINSVEYYYVGDDKDFDLFLKSVVQKYLSEDVCEPEFSNNVEKQIA